MENVPEKSRVFLDEAGTNLGMTRSHAHSLEGKRALFKRPTKRGGNISLVGAIRLDESPVLYPFDGAVDGERFLYFLEHHLAPTLRAGNVVIMDNCRIHHFADVKTLLGKVGAEPLFMPPYSPELYPLMSTHLILLERPSLPKKIEHMLTMLLHSIQQRPSYHKLSAN